MSKYRRIETQFKDEITLRQALTDVCKERDIAFEAGEALILYGYQGDPRPEIAEYVIRRNHISCSANDLGFHRRADGTFEIIISEYDSRTTAAHIVREVKQRYARLQVEKLARARGYRVEEIPAQGGAVRLRLIATTATRRPVRAYVRR